MPTRTFLFVDQVRSTEQLTRLGDAAAHELRRALFDLLRQATEVAGGQEVDFTGDGLFCAFEGAAEAVDAAVTMQQLAWSFNGRRGAESQLAIRIGVNTGEPLESEGGGYFGVAVVIAARLCAIAEEGQILASDVVRALVEPRGVYEFAPLGRLDLKGVPETVATTIIRWAPDEARRRLPPALDVTTAAPFVGRSEELAAVDHAWQTVRGGARRLVLVSGEAGIGVSRFLAEAAGRAGADGAAIWFGQGDGVGQQLGAWAEAFGGWAAGMPRAELRLALGDKGSELARLVPELTTWLPRLTPPTRVEGAAGTFLAAGALDEVIVRWSAQEPMVVVLDRLEEADADTLAVIRRVCESVRDARLLVLAGYEPSAVGTPRVLAALQGVRDLVDVHLHGLDEQEIAQLVAGATGEPAADQQLRAIARESEGSPYFVLQMASALRRRGITTRVEEAIHRADGLRADLRLQREEITLGLRQLEQLREPSPTGSQSVEPDGTPPADVPCPYKGLVPFQPEDAEDFCGRELLVAELVARVASNRFVAVVGPSGSGKSSVVRAGLVPALARDALPGSVSWVPVVIMPGVDPRDAVDTALASIPDGARAVLVVDQAEQLWTLATEDDRRRVLDRLVALAADEVGTIVVVVLRADHYGRAADHEAFAGLVADSQVLVGPMTSSELRSAVERPAAAAGLVLEPGLVQAIVDDSSGQPGVLPLVSTALLETWQRRRGRSLTLAGHAEAGGVRGAIAHLADSAYGDLDPPRREAARRVLLRMASPGAGGDDVARPLPLTELAGDDEARSALDHLTARRLVTVSATTAQVAHEALLREWPRLRGWLEADRETRLRHHQIASAATEWEASGHDSAALLRGSRLAVALDLVAAQPDRLNAIEHALVAASDSARTDELGRARRTTRRFQLLAAGLVVLLVGALAASGFALVQRRQATLRAEQADARGLAAQALAHASTTVDRALVLGVEGHRRDQSVDTEGGLLAALNGARYLTAYRPTLAGLIDTAVSDDGRTVWTIDTEGVIRRVDSLTWTKSAPLLTASAPPRYLAASADGARLLYADEDGSHVVDTRTGRQRGPTIGRSPVTAGSISPDGTTVLAHDRSTRQALVVDAATGRQRAAIRIGAGITTVGALRPGHDEVVVATWSSQSLIRRYDLDGTPLGPERDLDLGPIDAVSASPDGKQYVIVSANRVLLVDAETFEPVGQPAVLRGGRTNDHAFSPDGAVLAVTGDDGSVTVIDRADSSIVTTINGLEGASWPEFLSSRRLLAVTDNQAAEYDLDRPVAIADAVRDSAFVASSALRRSTGQAQDQVLVSGETGLALIGADLQRTTVPMESMNGWFRDAVAVAPGGKLAAVHRYFLDQDHMAAEAAVDLIDLPSGRVRGTVPLNGRIEEHRFNPRLLFSPDGSRVAVGMRSGAVALLDADRYRVVLPPTDVDSMHHVIVGLWWAPDGTALLAGGQDGILYELDPATGRPRRQVELAAGGGISGIAPVPDSTLLAVSTEAGQVFVVDFSTMTLSGQPLSAGATQLQAVAVSPDGQRIAASSRDGAIRIWERTTGRAVGPALGAHSEGSELMFASDGRLISVGYEGTMLVWRLDATSLEQRACELAGRNLTQDEWRRFLPDRDYRVSCPGHPSGT